MLLLEDWAIHPLDTLIIPSAFWQHDIQGTQKHGAPGCCCMLPRPRFLENMANQSSLPELMKLLGPETYLSEASRGTLVTQGVYFRHVDVLGKGSQVAGFFLGSVS